jgi:malate synthase
MATHVDVNGLKVNSDFHDFIVEEALPGSGVNPIAFWLGLSSLIEVFVPRNKALLVERDRLQGCIDKWHRNNHFELGSYRRYLERIGYLLPQGASFQITTTGVDPEIAEIAGPQLVVPVINARYALNAANARWGSLYDALYGSDALGVQPTPGPYDPERGSRVIEWVRDFLDEIVPLSRSSHSEVYKYRVVNGDLVAELDGYSSRLADRSVFAGYQGSSDAPTSLFLRHHGLHIELVIDPSHPVGSRDRAGIADVILESAVTSIMDCEDSVAAVDANDKVVVYRNWLGLMKGDLSAEIAKDGHSVARRLVSDRKIVGRDGISLTLPGRSLMLVRNVGLLMTTGAVLDRAGKEVPEGLLDAMVTVLAAKHDLLRGDGALNSSQGSVYVVKPKVHGPQEVAFVDDVFSFVEQSLDLPQFTVKIGLMDEERRTSLNLAECVRAAARRIAFINTGFLDRTGDEIHTSMQAGPMVRKAEMHDEVWLQAYEDNNVDVGLACGFQGRAQIGKGMWAAPELMADMLRDKIAQPLAGANCAWVPSPTAATLHATHFHRVNVGTRQQELAGRARSSIDHLLAIPIKAQPDWSQDEIRRELENNAQGILGYVVRWVDQGIGCSKVPDINDVALMEDRATCRISSQHIANWLYNGIVSREEVLLTMRMMAQVVDHQNANDPAYSPISPRFDGLAFRAACDLVLGGAEHPSGYTEPVLHSRRLERKAQIVKEP